MSRAWQVLVGLALAASLAVDWVLPGKEAKHVWDHETFYAWFGLLGCMAMILAAKAVGKRVLQRPEGYYDELRGDADPRAASASGPGTEARHAD